MKTDKALGIEKLLRIGPKPNVIQIVPPRSLMRPAVRRESDPADAHDLLVHPLAAPTGPGGAAGFRNRAGSTIALPHVTNIYMGPFWGDRTLAEAFSKAVVENGYLDPLRELKYGTGSGTYLGPVTGPDLTPKSTFTDTDARATLAKMLASGTIHGDENSLFVFILPDKVKSAMPDGAISCKDYCGYHDALAHNGTDVAYAVLPSPLCQGCGSEIGDFTAVYAHEVAEACTDKVPGKGWVADDGQENGDLEAWILFGWGPPSSPNLYTVQGYYTNERGNTVGKWRVPATATKLAGAQLGPGTAQDIVVNATPLGMKKFRGPEQLLRELGVNDSEVEGHKAAIIDALTPLGLSIDAADIASGPAVSVGTCSFSVLSNAS